MSSTLCGKHLHVQVHEMAFNVYQWIKSQNEDQCTKESKEKVSRATGPKPFSSVSLEDWVSRCKHVIKTESDYLQNEQLIDVRTEKLTISVNGEDSDSDFGIDFEDSD
ncbi:hypothetical protein FQA39_LY07110 [Lamprigera yunnana]|nr:hypothetical protein FQA39_LY07110 [Lamprigera yunnana]